MASILVLFLWMYFSADDIAVLSFTCYGLQRLLDICSEYGCQWGIKFNPDKSYAGTLGGDSPTSVIVETSTTGSSAEISWLCF